MPPRIRANLAVSNSNRVDYVRGGSHPDWMSESPNRSSHAMTEARGQVTLPAPASGAAQQAARPQAGIVEIYQCTPRISAATAICSLVGCSSSALPAMPLAAAESGNKRNAEFMMIS